MCWDEWVGNLCVNFGFTVFRGSVKTFTYFCYHLYNLGNSRWLLVRRVLKIHQNTHSLNFLKTISNGKPMNLDHGLFRFFFNNALRSLVFIFIKLINSFIIIKCKCKWIAMLRKFFNPIRIENKPLFIIKIVDFIAYLINTDCLMKKHSMPSDCILV